MCDYKKIENITYTNGKTIGEINREVYSKVENIYREAWSKGVSVPFWDDMNVSYLANPDGSEDQVSFDKSTRTYTIIARTAPAGCGRFAYLLKS